MTAPDGMIHHCRASWRAASLAAAILTLGGALPASAETMLRPGDTVKLSILGLPASELTSVIDADGYLTLAWFGRVKAADRSLTDILTEVQNLTTGQLFKRYTNEGVLKLIQLTPQDVSLEIVAYRPVIVSGEVARPAEVPFRPGLTVRGAIAIAGGVRSSLLTDVTSMEPAQIVRWQNDYSRATIDHAVALSRLWRISAEINNETDPAPLPTDQVAVSPEVLGALLQSQRELMKIKQTNETGDRAFLQASLERARVRLGILIEQRANSKELLSADEAEEKRVRELVDRDLVPAARLTDVRRTTVLTATNLLELEEKLSTAELEVSKNERLIDEYEEMRMTDLLTQREQQNATVLEARLRMDQLAQNLTGATIGESSVSLSSNRGINVWTFRRVENEVKRVDLTLDSELEPGDVLEVALSMDAGPMLPSQ